MNMDANVNAAHYMGANVNMAPVMGAYENMAPVMGAYENMAPVMGENIPPQPTQMAPSYGYACPVPSNDTFVLIVVLFILLIIIGTCYFPKC
jgi:uncharacterized protein (TIGR01732 family)